MELLRHNARSIGLGLAFLAALTIAHFAQPAKGEGYDPYRGPRAQTELSASRATAAPATTASTSSAGVARPGAYAVVEVAQGGTVRGTVRFSARPPARRIAFNKDQAACGHPDQPSQRMVYDDQALTVANCFVYLSDIAQGKAFTGEFARDEDSRVALLDQVECTYVPHVLAIRTGTQVRIKNSDPAEHNVHMYRGSTSGPTQANVLSPAGSDLMPGPTFIEKPAVYEVKCDIHAWMNGYVWALNHPYFAVTGKNGAFELKDVPPGTYTLVMWHEGMEESPQMSGGGISGYEYSAPVEESRSVEVGAGATVTADFVIEPAAR